MAIDNKIITHYTQKDTAETTLGNDHLHIGGEKATRYFFDKIDLQAGMRVLDIGCGLGGPAILAAQDYSCHVTGIDLTPDFIDTARAKARAAQLDSLTDFQTANAARLTFPDNSFNLAIMLHVGMNIPNKAAVFAEAARVLKPSGALALYDILALENIADMTYPCPWAKTSETSFLEDYEVIERHLKAAGLQIEHAENCQDYAEKSITKMIETMGNDLTPPRKTAVQNLLANIKHKACAPFIIIAHKSA